MSGGGASALQPLALPDTAAAAGPSALSIWDSAAPFCPLCGSLLLFPNSGDVACDVCPFTVALASMAHAPSRASSKPKPTPEWLLEWRAADAARRGDAAGIEAEAARVAASGTKHALVSEDCAKCKNPQMEYWTMQTRSADEGQTVFYRCPKCAYMYSINT